MNAMSSRHHRFARTDQHEREDRKALDDHQAHRGLPRSGGAHQLKGDDGVQTHAGRKRDRHVRDDAHENRTDRRSGCGRCDGRLKGDPRGAQDRGVREQDVRHGEERRHAAAQLAGDGSFPGVEIEEGFDGGE